MAFFFHHVRARIHDNDETKTAVAMMAGDDGLAARRFRRRGEERTRRKGRDLSRPDGWPCARARVCDRACIYASTHARARRRSAWRPWLAGNNFRMNLNGGLHACLLSLSLLRSLSSSFFVHLLIHLSRTFSLSLSLYLVRTASLPLCRTTVFSSSCHLSLSSFSFSSSRRTFLLFFSML